MEVARITTKGQITIPIEIRKKLNLKEGDKIIFLEQDGRIYFENAALLAFNRIQDAMAGEAQKAGYNSPEEMNELVKEIRKEMWEERYANNQTISYEYDANGNIGLVEDFVNDTRLEHR